MKNSNLYLYLIMSFFIVNSVLFKACILFVLVFLAFKKYCVEINKIYLLEDVICCLLIILLNRLVTLNLDIINFIFFVIGNVLLEKKKVNIKKETYISIYFFLVLVRGVFRLCLKY